MKRRYGRGYELYILASRGGGRNCSFTFETWRKIIYVRDEGFRGETRGDLAHLEVMFAGQRTTSLTPRRLAECKKRPKNPRGSATRVAGSCELLHLNFVRASAHEI